MYLGKTLWGWGSVVRNYLCFRKKKVVPLKRKDFPRIFYIYTVGIKVGEIILKK